MEWKDIETKKKGKACFCKLEGPLSNGGCSDGSIYREIPLDGSEGRCITHTWLPPKLASVGKTVTLKHPDTQKELKWKVITAGKARYLNEDGHILWGAGYA